MTRRGFLIFALAGLVCALVLLPAGHGAHGEPSRARPRPQPDAQVDAQVPSPPSSQAPVPVSTQSADRTRTIAMIGIIVLAVVYLRLADEEPRAPRSLIKFGRAGREEDEAP